MANTYLTRTPSSSGNRLKWTWSGWVKRGTDNQDLALFGAYQSSSYNTYFKFGLGGDIRFADVYNGSDQAKINTLAKFRDLSSWYHLVLVYDKNNSTSTDRLILYVNGVRITDFDGSIMPSQSTTFNVDNVAMQLGAFNAGSNFNGLMSHVHFSDGYALAPTVFGETDATTGEWKIKTSPSFTLGTNGFTILKDGNTITDQSTNSNNFTLGAGTLTKTEDNPSNVFATGNRLNVNAGAVGTFTNGNNTIKVANSSGSVFGSSSTLGMTTGKFYCEAKIITVDSTMIGVSPSPSEDARNNRSPSGASSSGAVGCLAETGTKYVSGTGTTYGAATSTDGIMMIALDLDNLKVYFGSGGQWSNGSGAWNQSGLTSGAAISITAAASTAEGAYFFSFGDGGGSNKGKVAWNFGNGYFATAAVASAGTNASGNGIFEYDVPTGFTALSTKGLNL